ncbi:MAG: tetratricopeptide repeat protein [Acidobacteria bacterium]|nr:tetratricopeptide repeat protein [Acidobacteriota bacterium]
MATQASTLATAQSLHRSGDLILAESLYLKLLDANPANSEGLHYLGLLHADTGRGETAIQLLRAAIAFEGPQPSLCRNLGIVLEREGNRPAAIACYLQAAGDSAGDAALFEKIARLCALERRFGDAANAWDRCLALSPAGGGRALECRKERARCLALDGQRNPAFAEFQRILAEDPVDVSAQFDEGVLLMQTDRTAEARESFARTLLLAPGHAEAANNLGILQQIEKQYASAIGNYRHAIVADRSLHSAFFNLGSAWHEFGQARKAICVFRKYLKLQPGNAAAWTSLGNAWLARNDLSNAGECYRETLRLAPGEPAALWNLGISALLAGDLQAGWQGYERRFDVEGATPRRPFAAPIWNGENIEGKTLLFHAEQGLGDTLQFIRYAPRFAAEGARVLVECQAPLLSLLRGLPGVDQWFAAPTGNGSGPAPVDHLPVSDFQLPMLSAPAVARTGAGDIPLPGGYLKAPRDTTRRWAEWLGPRTSAQRFGLVWAGNPNHKNDRNRSIPARALAQLANVPDVEWVNLQKGHPAPASLSLRYAAPLLSDFACTAGLIANLDAVVSVDTSVAHLAGALGKPVWILLPYAPDWRWMLNRSDSPWYRSARLFRQPEPGDWASVLQEVRKALRR